MTNSRQSNSKIDRASADSFIAEKRIGERIRRLRLKRSMGLVELGRHTGISASFLSQLETGRVVPTLRNLARIAMVFGKDLHFFFESEVNSPFNLYRKKDRLRLPQTGVDDPTYYFESIGYLAPDRQFDPYYAEFVPTKKGAELGTHMHAGVEFLYVIRGELEIRHAGKSYSLEEGDGAYFDAGAAHAYRCSGAAPAAAVIVTMHAPAALPIAQAKIAPIQAKVAPIEDGPGGQPSFAAKREAPSLAARSKGPARSGGA